MCFINDTARWLQPKYLQTNASKYALLGLLLYVGSMKVMQPQYKYKTKRPSIPFVC